MTGGLVRVVGLRAEAGGRRLLDDVSFELPVGRVLAVVGASGSGKTTLGRALLGEAGVGVRLAGRVEIAGQAITVAQPPPPGTVGYVPQQPSAVLNPVRRIGPVLHEIARRHLPAGGSRAARRERLRQAVRVALHRVSLPADRDLLRRFPHQLSGGQQQRLVIAHVLLAGARLLVADEPTTGQDNLTRREVAAELTAMARSGMAVVLLSHDLRLVRAVADELLVLDRGRSVEAGPSETVFAAPRDELTRRLLTPPAAEIRTAVGASPPILRVAGLVAGHCGDGRRRTALERVNLSLAAGECLALAGRSGSGKTTLARCVAGLHEPHAGTVELAGRTLAATLAARDRATLAAIQYVFQDARASFDPWRPVLDQVARPTVRLHGRPVSAAREAARAALERVGLTGHLVTRDPSRLSGGELHRAALARALVAEPWVLICDEITAGLDAVARDSILALLDELRRADGLALLLISHEREVIAQLADRVVVLNDGQVVEEGPAGELLTAARHPLSRTLLSESPLG